MSSILSSQGVVLATALAVSGTVILLTFCRHKTLPTTQFAVVGPNPDSTPQILRSCISSDRKKREKKKKRVHFAEDVVDPVGNSEEFRREHRNSLRCNPVFQSESRRVPLMAANQMALYNGILRDRVHRTACSN